MDFEQEINRLIADIPEMAARSLEKAQREMIQNPPPGIQHMRDEIEYLKVVDAVFTGRIKRA
ncbi:MAG: hypothetical protein LIO54_08385 [Oscillospiraceae bacterium]|nr:hypothetical protein [Oscillospiraceae bacterium]